MKYLFYCLLLAIGFAAGWYVYRQDEKQLYEISVQQEKLKEQNKILLIGNVRLKKDIDKNLTILELQQTTIDSLKKLRQNDRKTNSNRITNLATATDSAKLDLWAGYAGEN